MPQQDLCADPSSIDYAELEQQSRRLRATCVQIAHDGKESHLNGAMSSVDLLVALYSTWLNASPKDPDCPDRDRLFFSKGHACTSLYAVLAEHGFIDMEWLHRYATNDSPLPSHPCKHALPLLEASSGSLGHGLGLASGVAYGLRLDSSSGRAIAFQ